MKEETPDYEGTVRSVSANHPANPGFGTQPPYFTFEVQASDGLHNIYVDLNDLAARAIVAVACTALQTQGHIKVKTTGKKPDGTFNNIAKWVQLQEK